MSASWVGTRSALRAGSQLASHPKLNRREQRHSEPARAPGELEPRAVAQHEGTEERRRARGQWHGEEHPVPTDVRASTARFLAGVFLEQMMEGLGAPGASATVLAEPFKRLAIGVVATVRG